VIPLGPFDALSASIRCPITTIKEDVVSDASTTSDPKDILFPDQPAPRPEPAIVPNRFAGRTAIVTGAGSGIGRATALRLAREGAHIVAADVSAGRLEALVAEHGDLDIRTVVGDISTEEGAQAVVAAADGRVDALANVAGIMDGFLPAAEVDDSTWERVLAVNVTAPMRLVRLVLPLMQAASSGAIVNVSSEAGLRGSSAGVAYTVSKHAVNGLTRSVAALYGKQGIRSNAVAPGGVMTNIEVGSRSDYAIGIIGPIAQATAPAAASPEELAASITWLLSDDAVNVNGVVLPSDGGWSAI
jgi:NAD(P)-dependent dehydrogenase (short-subunit alcohol dehydrogenase family)